MVNNGGLGPNGLPVGPHRSAIANQNLQYRAHLDAFAQSECGPYVRRVRAAGSIQLLSERQSFLRPPPDLSSRPSAKIEADGSWAPRERVVHKWHSQHQGGHHVSGHHPHRKGQFRSRGSEFQRGMLERRWQPEHRPQPDQFQRLRRAPGESELQSAAGLLRLHRTAALPGSDGCPSSTSGLYTFNGHANIRELALFFQDNITVKNWTFNLGVRFDYYDGITSAKQGEPRLGAAYNFKPTNTCFGSPTPARSKRRSTRIWSWRARDAATRW